MLLFSGKVTSNSLQPISQCAQRCLLSPWCHPTVLSSVTPFSSSCPQSFPALGSFLMSWLFASGGQSIGASTSLSIQWILRVDLRFIRLISLQSKRLWRVFSSTTIWKHQFFSFKSSLWSNFHYGVSSYFQMYNTLSLAYSNYKYLSEHKCLDNKDQYKTKHWNLIGIGLGKVVRQRNKLRKPNMQECTIIENSKRYQFVIIEQRYP